MCPKFTRDFWMRRFPQEQTLSLGLKISVRAWCLIFFLSAAQVSNAFENRRRVSEKRLGYLFS